MTPRTTPESRKAGSPIVKEIPGTNTHHSRAPLLFATLLVGLCLCLYLPGFSSIPVTDRDEARFVQATKQMMETGNFIDIHFQDAPRYKKPIGVYWLQAATLKIFSLPLGSIWAYRIPSTVAALLAVLGVFLLGYSLVSSGTGLMAATILASTSILMVEAHLAKADASLLATIVGALGSLTYLMVMPESKKNAKNNTAIIVLMWVSLALGTLIKGPVAPGVFTLTLLGHIFCQRSLAPLYRIRPIMGILLMLTIIAPWFLAIQSSTHGSFLREAWYGDIMPKFLGVHESHWGPPGYYLLTSLLTFWPWTPLLAVSIPWLWKHRNDPLTQALLCWIVPSWIVLEITPTKLPHYTLPLFPPLALASALAISSPVPENNKASKRLFLLFKYSWMIVALALPLGLIAMQIQFGNMNIGWALPSATLFFIAAYYFSRLNNRTFTFARFSLPVILAITGLVSVFGLVLPRASDLWISQKIHTTLTALNPRPAKTIVVGLSEPSLVFLEGTDRVVFSDSATAASLLADRTCTSAALVRDRELDNFTSRLSRDTNEKLIKSSDITAFNYSNGKWITLSLFLPVESRCEPM